MTAELVPRHPAAADGRVQQAKKDAAASVRPDGDAISVQFNPSVAEDHPAQQRRPRRGHHRHAEGASTRPRAPR